MSDVIDDANDKQEQILDAHIENRVRFTEWDGLDRECESCLNMIDPRRLAAVNATTCITCQDNEERKR